jgi:hypothetical protein
MVGTQHIQGKEIFETYNRLKAEHPDLDEWVSEAIALEFGEDMLDVIHTAAVCHESYLPWLDWRAFEKVAVVINGREVIGDIVQDLDPKEIAYAALVLKAYFPDHEYDEEVCRYMALILADSGLVIAPPQLDFLQPYLPMVKLDADQEKVQEIYLSRVLEYIRLMLTSALKEG